MTDPIRAALERLLAVVKPKYTDPDEIVAAALAIGAARAALLADGPAVAEGREPAAVVGEPSDEELDVLANELLDCTPEGIRAFARAALARWGRQSAPPAEEEVGKLVRRLRYAKQNGNWILSGIHWELDDGTEHQGIIYVGSTHANDCARAAELLSQRHPAPVPVSEQPWAREGWCDEQGRCWLRGKVEGDWRLLHPVNSGVPQLKYCFSHSLPATALPLPAFWDGDCDKTSTPEDQ